MPGSSVVRKKRAQAKKVAEKFAGFKK